MRTPIYLSVKNFNPQAALSLGDYSLKCDAMWVKEHSGWL